VSKSYGGMVGFDEAVSWVRDHAPEDETKSMVMARLSYERDKAVPVKPKFNPGIYGHKYDSWSCGNCGHGMDVNCNYCPNCGFAVGWDWPRCMTDYKREED